ncbi:MULTISPECIES: phosphoribosyltransferase family protein [Chryseobacterium]|uniref:PRTase ComF-like n=1 Tax=Chryseobacterium camelliae TaxID=1265445 RepID=A0ABU0TFE9_9FLAO|nr:MULTISPECIES: phosphoribosyltransferase family protein [Chryseobacterium]MDT3407209.1 hypothetical protein [Pseudacidovorax intermedius]MDQ1095000.1 hypothetical protein [Chryseobacterium camelliae]MDQ1098940.1 hypothetical protein [Chryseobacterium sp. SORGH_AS_1048]MDR6086288.1 hypothetical protein [Chryseobacterium sp. SORGH_AS_0909]MDR6130660.1 hypothetical protein [Chryseobacterium sp. SORGH_AS_1175]
MNTRYSLHHIHTAEEFTFSPESYSYFKYGLTSYAEKFAKELFAGFIVKHGNMLLQNKEIVVLPSPYMAIPTASNFLCFYFKKHLDFYLFQKGKKSSVLSKINRNQTYITDYGNLSFEERKNLIANDTYYIDKDFLKGKLCLFIDDIKITGSHEYTVNKILDQYKVEGDFLFIYYAELMNKDIDPTIENFFNYYAVKNVEHVAEVMKSPDFEFNTRIVKYILGLDSGKFDYLTSTVKKEQMDLLLELAISNNYHLIKEYKNNINILTQTELYHGY